MVKISTAVKTKGLPTIVEQSKKHCVNMNFVSGTLLYYSAVCLISYRWLYEWLHITQGDF